jgi:hypothetical protein
VSGTAFPAWYFSQHSWGKKIQISEVVGNEENRTDVEINIDKNV